MAPETAARPPLSKSAVFFRRFISTILLWAAVLVGLFGGSSLFAQIFFLLVLLVLSGLGLAEFYQLASQRGLICYPRLGLVFGMGLVGLTFFTLADWARAPVGLTAVELELGLLVLFLLGTAMRALSGEGDVVSAGAGLVGISTTMLGLWYVPWLLDFIAKIYFFEGIAGRYYVLYFLVVTKFSDLGAYLVGSLIGRHKLIPRISPAKTWEGLGGAMLVSVMASIGFAAWAGEHLRGMSWGHAMVLGMSLGAGAVLGDLIESLFKREAGAKDSGQWFPGIGGILDLLDSLLFNAPLMYLYLRYFLV